MKFQEPSTYFHEISREMFREICYAPSLTLKGNNRFADRLKWTTLWQGENQYKYNLFFNFSDSIVEFNIAEKYIE